MPTSLDTATAISDQINPRLNLAKIDLEIAKRELYAARGDLSPSASITYEKKKIMISALQLMKENKNK